MKKHEIGTLLGNKIKELREMRGFSQAELANKCSKSIETISNFERAKTIPSVMTLGTLAKALEIEIHTFFEFAKKTDKKSKNASFVESRIQLLSADDQELLMIFIDSLCKQRSNH